MTLPTTSMFASFDITDGSQDRDISPVLAAALLPDLTLLGNINVDFSSPVQDILHYWNEDALNSDTAIANASYASTAISMVSTAANIFDEGDLIQDITKNSGEIMQVSEVASTTQFTVERGYGDTTAASIAAGAVFARIPATQEGSDIGSDRTVKPVVRSNYCQILPGNDILITGTQLARKMATDALADQIAHQLANRAMEFKRGLTRAALYGEKGAAGSDTSVRTFGGLRYWNRTGAGNATYSTSGAVTYAILNAVNKTIVDMGKYPDTLVVGTDLANTIAGWDASYRRLRESDKQVGYMVNEVLLSLGNTVKVVVDGRVMAGDAFLFSQDQVKLLPMVDRAMFIIAATDFADAKKRRILGEWTMEVRNPEATGYISNAS